MKVASKREKGHSLSQMAFDDVLLKQARRESNPQPPVLETGALPIELRTYKPLHLPFEGG